MYVLVLAVFCCNLGLQTLELKLGLGGFLSPAPGSVTLEPLFLPKRNVSSHLGFLRELFPFRILFDWEALLLWLYKL